MGKKEWKKIRHGIIIFVMAFFSAIPFVVYGKNNDSGETIRIGYIDYGGFIDLNENGEAVNNNDEGGLENGKSDTSVSPAGLALFSSEGMEAPGGDVVSRMGVADGVNSSHLGVSNEDFYSRRSKNMNIIDKPVREIKEIRVFFSDGTYEAFVPSGK